jgi:hypothetical protein
MGRTYQELTHNIDDGFKTVIDELTQLFVTLSVHSHGRATHTSGVAARGVARIIVPYGFPQNDFIRDGKFYPIIVRHAKPGPQRDDRTLDGGAVSIKFQEPDSARDSVGFQDIMMNTGRTLFVNSARAFNTMVHTDPKDLTKRMQLVLDRIVCDEKLSEGYRTGSFTEFYYHSQICFEYRPDDGESYYIRFRLIPGDRGPERGRFPEALRANGVTTAVAWLDDQRSENFMREDFKVKVSHLGVRYILQLQIRPIDANKDVWLAQEERERRARGLEAKALDPSELWDERFYPWSDMAELVLNEILTEAEVDGLAFDANWTHPSIALPLATGPDEYASLGHARALVYEHARKARAASPQPHIN